jgi:hypothetical protein
MSSYTVQEKQAWKIPENMYHKLLKDEITESKKVKAIMLEIQDMGLSNYLFSLARCIKIGFIESSKVYALIIRTMLRIREGYWLQKEINEDIDCILKNIYDIDKELDSITVFEEILRKNCSEIKIGRELYIEFCRVIYRRNWDIPIVQDDLIKEIRREFDNMVDDMDRSSGVILEHKTNFD